MKYIITILFGFALYSSGDEPQDPFVHEIENHDKADDVHRWDNKIVEDYNIDLIKFSGNNSILVDGDSVRFTFSVDKKNYLDSLEHEDNNRGVVLISGSPESPLIYCWMRPFMFTKSRAVFVVEVPKNELVSFYVAYIPKEGKLRYIYNLSAVVENFKL